MTPSPAPGPWWVAPAVLAAVIMASIAAITLMVNGRRVRRDRHRELFGAAFGDVARYCEFPYIVRRRRHDAPAEERVRISTELSEVQSKLNHNLAVLRVEAPRVAAAYSALVDATRDVAGGAIRAGWNEAAATSDAGVHVTDVDLRRIKPLEDAYLTAVADHLAIAPACLRTIYRRLARGRPSPEGSDEAELSAGRRGEPLDTAMEVA